MPYKPRHPCGHPGCPELVESGRQYCEKHLPLHPEYTRSASSRGYTSKWQRESKKFLAAHPLCEWCRDKGIYRKATVVHHKIPHLGDPELFWDRSQWVPLCKECHDKHTGLEDSRPRYHY